MELYDRVVTQYRADGQDPARRIHPNEVTDQKISMAVLVPIFFHDDADEQRMFCELLIRRLKPLVERLQYRHCRPAIEFPQNIALTLGHEHRLANRPAS